MSSDNSETKNYCDAMRHALIGHITGNATPEQIISDYEIAFRSGGHQVAKQFMEWFRDGMSIDLPIPLYAMVNDDGNDDPTTQAVIDYLQKLKTAPPETLMFLKEQSPALRRGLRIMGEVAKIYGNYPSHIWHSIHMVHDMHALGLGHDHLVKSINRAGPTYNVLDEDGVPIPMSVYSREENEPEGIYDLTGIRFENGRVEMHGTSPGPLSPLLTQDDLDVALSLAFLDESPTDPYFSLDMPKHPFATHRLNKKTFKPEWLAETAFGQSLFLSDWMMKGMVVGNIHAALPSLTMPDTSSSSNADYEQTNIFKALIEARYAGTKPTGNLDGRYAIFCRGVDLSVTTHMSSPWDRTTDYTVENSDVYINSSYYQETSDGIVEHYIDDPETSAGAQAAVFTEYYDYIGTHYPVFARVKQLLTLSSTLAQARNDGMTLADDEIARLEAYKALMEEAFEAGPDIEYVPRMYHNHGCYCTGGVQGTSNGKILNRQQRSLVESIKSKPKPIGMASLKPPPKPPKSKSDNKTVLQNSHKIIKHQSNPRSRYGMAKALLGNMQGNKKNKQGKNFTDEMGRHELREQAAFISPNLLVAWPGAKPVRTPDGVNEIKASRDGPGLLVQGGSGGGTKKEPYDKKVTGIAAFAPARGQPARWYQVNTRDQKVERGGGNTIGNKHQEAHFNPEPLSVLPASLNEHFYPDPYSELPKVKLSDLPLSTNENKQTFDLETMFRKLNGEGPDFEK